MKNGIYIYGFVRSSEPQVLEGISSPTSQVRMLPFKDIAAVVADSPFVVYSSLAKEDTIKALVSHQFVIEKVMTRITIVPVKFGTMVESEDDVYAFLEQGYPLISAELSKMAEKIELDVVASWDLSKILAALPRLNPQVQEKQKQIALKGGQASTEDKIALGKVIEQALQSEKARYQRMILQTLKRGSADMRLHTVANDEMILNAAYLVHGRDEEAFTEAINVLDRDLANTINFRVVGPLPVYSFSTIMLERIDPQKFEEARKMFGLDGEITDKTVRDGYHQLAHRSHPDTSNGADVPDFHAIHSAYRMLKDYTEKGLVHVGVYQWENDMA